MTVLYEQLIEGIIANGYGVADQFLPAEAIHGLAALLHARHEAGAFKEAGIGKSEYHNRDYSIRGDRIFWLEPNSDEVLEQQYLQQVGEFMQYMNQTCFTGLHDCEIHYALYPVGTFYKTHVDRFVNDTSRQYSLIMYLNEDWQEADGGQLLLHLDNGETVQILPLAGRVVCFPSHLIPHEVLPARRPRLSLTGWLKK